MLHGEIHTVAHQVGTENERRLTLSISSYSLEENGQTALGPALLLSVFLAAKVPGSRVSNI